MSQQLQPCRACQADALVHTRQGPHGILHRVECSRCQGSTSEFYDVKVAMDLWNHRTRFEDEPPLGEEPPPGAEVVWSPIIEDPEDIPGEDPVTLDDLHASMLRMESTLESILEVLKYR